MYVVWLELLFRDLYCIFAAYMTFSLVHNSLFYISFSNQRARFFLEEEKVSVAHDKKNLERIFGLPIFLRLL